MGEGRGRTTKTPLQNLVCVESITGLYEIQFPDWVSGIRPGDEACASVHIRGCHAVCGGPGTVIIAVGLPLKKN